MNLIIIIVLTVILVLTFSLITFLIWLFHKHRQSALNNFAQDLNQAIKKTELAKINRKELPVTVDEIKDDIYFCNKAVIGEYQDPKRIINEKNFNISHLLQNKHLEIWYQYKIITVGKTKFVPLNKIDLLMTKKHLYLYHPLEPHTIALKKITSITVFWERNPLVQKKVFFPGVAFRAEKHNYFLLFQNYQELIKFLASINLTTIS